MKKIYLLLKLTCMLLLVVSVTATGQTPSYYNAASGTGTNAFPWSTSTGKGIQWIVNAGEFSLPTPVPSGQKITEIWFYLASTTNATYSDFSVQLGQVSSNTDPSWANSAAYSGTLNTVVVASTRTITTSGAGWVSVPLDTAFVFDPSQALVVSVSQCGFTGTSSQGASTFTASGTRRKYFTPTSCVQVYGGDGSQMSPIGLTVVPTGPCTSPPTAGLATANDSTLCSGQSVSLGLSGNSNGTGQTYEWESGPSASGPWTSLGAASSTTGFTTIPPSGTTTYYHCLVTCGASTIASSVVPVTASTPFPAGIYTINASLPQSSTNFPSFTAAVAAINCGISGAVTFNVDSASGPYNEQIELPATIGATATNTVTFNGNGAILSNTVSAIGTNYATLNLDGADYITFNNLTVEAMGTSYGFAVHLMNSADNNTFSNCNIRANLAGTATTTGCVSMSGSKIVYSTAGSNGSNNTFNGCTLSGGYFGFSFYGSAPTGNTNNSITNCLVKEYYVYGSYNIQQGGATIANNIFERPTRTPVSTGYGVALSTGCTNMLVEKNRIRKLWDGLPTATGTTYCLYVTSVSTVGNENKIFNNVVSDINFNGTVYGLYLSGATHVQAYNNTISLDQSAATGTTTTYGIYATGTAGVDVENNLVHISRGGTGTKYCIYFTGAGKTSNYNNLHMGSTTGTNNVGYFSTAFATLTAWQGANGGIWDQNSVAETPIFANPAIGDYTPGNSLLDNKGTPLASITTDILGATRNATTPDIGAYEFSVPVCSGVPTSGTATVNTSTACVGTPISLSLGGFTIGTGITIQWDSSAAGTGVWYPIAGATSSNYNTVFSAPTDYHANVTCANGGQVATSNMVSVTQNPFYSCYCSPITGTTLHTSTANYITNVSILGTTLNSSTTVVGSGGYTQQNPSVPANTASLIQGQLYTLNLAVTSASWRTELWIDWDQNGTYDAAEYTLLPASTAASTSVIVPLTATTGMTGMRVRVCASTTTLFGSGGACSNISIGRETEDYVITVVATTPCSGVPTAGAATANTNTACVGMPINLSLSGFTVGTGISIQWDSAAAGTGVWYPIAGATLPYYNTIFATATDYQANVTCANGGQVATSNTVSITQNPFYSCYCSPNTGTTLHTSTANYITNVSIPTTTLNSSTSTVGAGGYTQQNPAISTNTANLAQGQTYTLNLAVTSASWRTEMWIDWDQNGTFDAAEYTQLPASTTPTTNIVVPGTATPGMTGMRVRVCASTTTNFGSGGACSNISVGRETEDYVLYIFNPLVIKMGDIKASNVGSRNRVDWNTLAEERGDGFEVERSTDGVRYTTLGTIPAKGNASTYTYWDESPVVGINYYRLKLTSASNSYVYSNVVSAKVAITTSFAVEAYPNPVSHQLNVKVYGTQGSNAKVTITDVTGKVVLMQDITSATTVVNMNGISSGVYLVKYTDSEHTQTLKITKQ